MADGANAAAATLNAEITWIDETCEPGSGPSIAEALKAAGVTAAIGFLCSESLEGGLPLLMAAGIPAISVSVRAPILMEDAVKYGWPFYRLAPSAAAEAQALVDVILRDWAGAAFALIEDGTIHGRELAETIRNTLEERGMRPAFLDTFRPGQEQQIALVRRLKKAGVTHVFIGGDRNDIAIIARDAASESTPLSLLGGESLSAADQPVPLATGVRAVSLPPWDTQPAGTAVAAALLQQGVVPEGYVLPTYAAVQVVEAASKIAGPLDTAMTSGSFETVIGPLAFGADHELTTNPYRLVEWNGTTFVLAPAGTQ